MENSFQHKSVLLDEIIAFLLPAPNCIYVDATIGSGGHAEKILEKSSPSGRLIGIDVDPSMLNLAKKRLRRFEGRFLLFNKNYIELKIILESAGSQKIDGIVFDLGVSTEHFIEADRGFSFAKNGPLDMRLNPELKISAEKIINEWKPEDLMRLLYKYGEESKAKRIVRQIIEERKKNKIETTGQLAEIVQAAVGGRIGKTHPATKTFQALRIAVNNELRNIETVLPLAIEVLKAGGRLCVISFHSLEDRIVKNIFRSFARSCICPPETVRCVCEGKAKIKIITKKPVIAERKELEENPRSRSAKLRVIEKN